MDWHYLYFFSERRVYCIFPTFLGSNPRYHVTSLFTSQYHKTRILKSICRAYAKNFYNPPGPKNYMRQMLKLILKENYFPFNGKLYLQTHRTAKYQLLKEEQNFLIRHCHLWLHLIKMMIPIQKAVAWLATRDTHACVREERHLTENGPFVSFCLFWPGYGLSGLCLAFLILCITWIFAK